MRDGVASMIHDGSIGVGASFTLRSVVSIIRMRHPQKQFEPRLKQAGLRIGEVGNRNDNDRLSFPYDEPLQSPGPTEISPDDPE
jgi:hypothetical protein